MVVEFILVFITLMLLGAGLFLGFGLGREAGRRAHYHRGFADGVEFARGQRRRQRGKPLHHHLRLVGSDDDPAAGDDARRNSG